MSTANKRNIEELFQDMRFGISRIPSAEKKLYPVRIWATHDMETELTQECGWTFLGRGQVILSGRGRRKLPVS